MAKSKKVLSLALAVVMLIGMLSIGVFAAKTTPTASISVTSSTSDAIQKGDTVTITVAATANEDYFVGPTAVPVTYDATLFEASDVVVSDLFGADTTEKVANTTKAGTVTVVITPKTAGEPVAPNLNGQNVVLYTFTLTAIADAGSCDVAVVDDQKTATNLTGKLYITSFDGADAREAELTTVGQTLVLDNASVNVVIGSVGDPELVLTEHGEEVGAVINRTIGTADGYDGCVMGIDTLGLVDTDSIEDCVTAENGYIEINTDDSDGNETTGAVIELYNNDGELVETYVFIFFGDLDRDANVTSLDATIVADYELTYEETYLDSEYMLIAADIDMDENQTSIDATILSDFEMTYDLEVCGYPTQAEIAAYYDAAF